MKQGHSSLLSIVALALISSPLVARADVRPDFDDDAKPILSHQPGLVAYVEANFDVKDSGTAKYPGDDNHRPAPPYIFLARPAGSNGPYNLRLLIQPGPTGHILGVVDITKAHLTEPGSAPAPKTEVANRQPVQQAPVAKAPSTPPAAPATVNTAVAPQPTAPAPAQPTADTPSGPITNNGQTAPASQPSLEPPPDPAPATH